MYPSRSITENGPGSFEINSAAIKLPRATAGMEMARGNHAPSRSVTAGSSPGRWGRVKMQLNARQAFRHFFVPARTGSCFARRPACCRRCIHFMDAVRCPLRSHAKSPNQTMQLTRAVVLFSFHMTKTVQPAATPALARGGSSYSR